MANTYDLSTIYRDDESVNPHWLMAIVRLRYPASIDHTSFKSMTGPENGVDERGEVLVVRSDCIAMSVSGTKGSHIKGLDATMKQGLNNYLLEIMPGDWCLAWMVNSQEKADDLVFRIAQKEACNGFDDGLKFVGRVSSIRKNLQQDPNGGVKTVTYSMQGQAFAELNSMAFHDQALQDADEAIGRWLARLNKDLNEIFLVSIRNVGGGATPDNNGHSIIPFLLNVLVGQGLPQDASTRIASIDASGSHDVIQTTYGSVTSKEASFAYLVPSTVGKLMGKIEPSKRAGMMAYADLLDMFVGVQSYPNKSIPSAKYAMLVPDADPDYPEARLNRWYTPRPKILGAFWPSNLEFTNKPLWSLLQQFLNPHVNEMYTAFKVNPLGNVVPTIVLRQQPFTSPVFDEPGLEVTKFLDLPRWKIPTSMVQAVNVGRSDATRINFVHVYGQAPYAGDNVALFKQIVINPPIRDDLDIQRSGLRPYMGNVAALMVDLANRVPTNWMKLVGDMNMGGHLQLNGALTCHGIEEPICEGDNIEWDDCVFQIESYNHTCQFDSTGGKRIFRTTLNLTHGMASDQAQPNSVNMYAGMPGATHARVDGLDPGLTYEGGDDETPTMPETKTESDEAPDAAPYDTGRTASGFNDSSVKDKDRG